MPNRSFEIAIRYLYTVFSVSCGKNVPHSEAAMTFEAQTARDSDRVRLV